MDAKLSRQFAALVLLDRLLAKPGRWHAGLLEGDDSLLEPHFTLLSSAGLVEIAADDHYAVTAKGYQTYQHMLHQQQSYLAHFDIYAWVDLEAGVFGDADKDMDDDPRWTDLRLTVARYKGIDPHRMVFLSLLAGESLTQEGSDWRHDMALGSAFFDELAAIVTDAPPVDALGYSDEDGQPIAGQEVLEDVILQGAEQNAKRLAKVQAQERAHEEAISAEEARYQEALAEDGYSEDDSEDDHAEAGYRDDDDDPDAARRQRRSSGERSSGGRSSGPSDADGSSAQNGSATPIFLPYDAARPMRAYCHSASYAERFWLEPYW